MDKLQPASIDRAPPGMAATGTPGNSLDLEDDVFIATDDHQDEDADVDADYEQLEASDEFGDEASSSDSSRTLLGSQSGRIYMVEKVERATGGYRPSFLFSGFLFDILQHGEQGKCHPHVLDCAKRNESCSANTPGSVACKQCRMQVHGHPCMAFYLMTSDIVFCILKSSRLTRHAHTLPAGGFTLQQVHDTKELQLSLRYEPPSPKFSRSCPGMSSYRCAPACMSRTHNSRSMSGLLSCCEHSSHCQLRVVLRYIVLSCRIIDACCESPLRLAS